MSNKIVKTGKKGGQLGNNNAQKWTEEKALNIGTDLLSWYEEDNTNILFEQFLRKRGLYRDLIGYLSRTFPSFLDLIKKAKQIQEERILLLGLTKVLNPTMCIFILKNVHGYRDQQQHDSVVTPTKIIYNYVGPPVDENAEPYYGDMKVENEQSL